MKREYLVGKTYKRTKKEKTQHCFCGSPHQERAAAASGENPKARPAEALAPVGGLK